jgi:hypothetical protein
VRSRRIILATAAALAAATAVLAALQDDGGAPTLQRCLALLQSGDLAGAEQAADTLAQSGQDGAWRANLVLGAARQRLGRHEQARVAYREYLASCSDSTEQQFVSEQIRLCRPATTQPRPPAAAAQQLKPDDLKRLSAVADEETIESSEHFVVRARNAELAKLVAGQAEKSLSRICGVLLPRQEYAHSVDVYVWPTIEDYRRHARTAAEWSGGSFSLARAENGAVTRRIDLTQLDKVGALDVMTLDRVLPHEMCHLVVTELFGQAYCPLAINEGLAMMSEAVVDNDRVRLTGAALRGDAKIALPELLTMDKCDADSAIVFYAESYSLGDFLHARLTPRQFSDLLANVKAGCSFDDALQRALCVPAEKDFMPRLAKAWEDYSIRNCQFLDALDRTTAARR